MAERFTQEEYAIAKEVKLIDYLTNNGYTLKKVGINEYTLPEHDSIRINPVKNTFYWNSQDIGGGTIKFLQEYEKRSLVEAIKILSGNMITPPLNQSKSENKNINSRNSNEIKLPEKNIDNKRVIAYLTRTRKIDFEIVNSLIKSGNLYESKEHHNAVFVGMDKGGSPKYASKRSTITSSTYKGDCEGSNKEFGFRINSKNQSQRLFVFEAAIDLMTHATISKSLGKDWKSVNRVSLGSLSTKSIENFLKDNSNIKEIVLFLDNDEAGQKNANKIYETYKSKYKVNIIMPNNKDLNQTWQDFLRDKENDKTLSFSKYIKMKDMTVEKEKDDFFLDGFPAKGNNQELYEFLLKNTNLPKKDIVEMFKQKQIYQDTDRNIIFVQTDENGVVKGGMRWNIYEKNESLQSIKFLDKNLMNEAEGVELFNRVNSLYNMVYKEEITVEEDIEIEK